MQTAAMAAAAVIYIPAGHPIDRIFWRAWAWVQHRGYDLYEVVRDMDQAIGDLDAGDAQVVVMMKPEAEPFADPEATTVIDLAVKRDRMMANEPTIQLPSGNVSPAERLVEGAARRWASEWERWRQDLARSNSRL